MLSSNLEPLKELTDELADAWLQRAQGDRGEATACD